MPHASGSSIRPRSSDDAGRRGVGGLEILVAVVISTAGLATSVASYQSEIWKGRQSIHLGRSSVHRVGASRAALEASINRSVEIDLFDGWLSAVEAGDTHLATLYVQRFPPGFRRTFDDWRLQQRPGDPGAPRTPFATSAYRQGFLQRAQALDARADAEFGEAQRALRRSEEFARAATVLALSMFCGGIGQAFASRRPRVILAAAATLTFLIGMGLMFSLPMLRLH